MDRVEKALEYFYRGYNCCQSVFAAYSDLFGVEESAALAISSGFGGGMGGLREKCGTVTALFMLAGLSKAGYDPESPPSKKELYDLIKALDAEFAGQFGTTNCRELLVNAKCIVSEHPSERNAKYYAKRPCARFVETAAEIAEKHLVGQLIKH